MSVEFWLSFTIIFYLLSSGGYLLFTVFGHGFFHLAARFAAWSGFLVHTMLLLYRIWLAGRPPFLNMYETLLFFSWLLVIFSAGVEKKYRVQTIGTFTFPLAFLSLGATLFIAGGIEPMMPSLRSNWFVIHVLTSLISYAAFAVAFSTSLLLLIKGKFGRKEPTEKAHELELMDSIAVDMIRLGFPFLTFGIVSGSVWADSSWGTYWSWDPKETWSLVTWLVYGIYFHLRHVSSMRGGWVALAGVMGFLCVLCNYFGVNYLLPTLHIV